MRLKLVHCRNELRVLPVLALHFRCVGAGNGAVHRSVPCHGVEFRDRLQGRHHHPHRSLCRAGSILQRIAARMDPLGFWRCGDHRSVRPVPSGQKQNVAMVRIQAQEGQESKTPEQLAEIRTALQQVDPTLTFASVDSVGPKVSGELVQSAVISVLLALGAVLFYVWLRFEWQFSVGAVAALVHDVVLTIGLFAVLQIGFDLSIIAALLTIVGYSLNDTVVVFDRVRENLIKFKKRPLREVLDLSINETLSRTIMTSLTTLIALIALFVLGGDVIRGFVFAMIWGVIVGTYSSVFVASVVLYRFGVKRDWSKVSGDTAGTQFGVKEG